MKDVMNRVAGMTRLEVKHMCPRRGGKKAPGWFLLAEGDVVYIDYPTEKIPIELKQRCEKEAARLAASSMATRRPKAAIPIVSPKEAASSLPAPSSEDTLIDLSINENKPSIQDILGLDFLPTTAPVASQQDSCTVPESLQPLVSPALETRATTPDFSVCSDSASSSHPQTSKKLMRIIFSFWFGKKYALEMHPEGRIADVAPILNAVLKQADTAATVEQLSYSASDTEQKVGAMDKIGSIFPSGPAEGIITVSLSEDCGNRTTAPIIFSESLI
ncbi:hypothetical protein TWF696_001071 [Orbilia brochopaga]|uniref:Uncharacterized protein n=1 Tax=Orbilia brochopaga TaxID=3140254 RepID=A0AAV9VGT3_9PEZI